MNSQRRRRASAPNRLRPAAKTPPPSFLARINDFLARTHNIPLWVLAGSLAAASIPFSWSFFNSYPEQRAYFDQESVRFHQALAAGDDVLHILDQLKAAFVSGQAVGLNYKQTFGGKSVGDALDHSQLEQGEALSHTAQSRFAVAAAVASADFPDASLNAAATAMRGDMQAQQKKMENFAALYAAALRSDQPAISAAIKQLRADDDQSEAINEALLQRWGHFSREADRFHAETAIEVDKARTQIWLFYIHQALAWLAGLYVIGFAIVGLRAFRRSR
jgi:predicted negative regulator of RcsB-dependent stress response